MCVLQINTAETLKCQCYHEKMDYKKSGRACD